MARVVVVGGGILGTMHAWFARRRGWEVVHLDRDAEPRSATVRNFGLIWVSGRAVGAELDLALRSRDLWDEVASTAPDVGLRPDGSLTLATTEPELEVLDAVARRDDAERRGFRVLVPDEVRALNPVLRGRFLAGLHCTRDAVVEPRLALPAIRSALDGAGYEWLPSTTAVEIAPGRVVDQTGRRHDADLILTCPGARADGPVARLLAGAPVRRVALQMMQTEPLGERLTTSLADGDSLRYYPAFDVPERAGLAEPHPLVGELHLQLLCSQRADGALTIGDTHHYAEPFDFALDERPYRYLRERIESFLGRPLPPIVRRWSGVYSQVLDDGICHRAEPEPGVWVITGPGGRGMTLGPAIAEATWNEVEGSGP